VIQLSRLLMRTAGRQSGGRKEVLAPTFFLLLSEVMINRRGWGWLLGEET